MVIRTDGGWTMQFFHEDIHKRATVHDYTALIKSNDVWVNAISVHSATEVWREVEHL